MRRTGPLLALCTLAALGAAPLAAQSGYFGQNHVQFRTFDWQVLRTEHFDVQLSDAHGAHISDRSARIWIGDDDSGS